MSDPQPDTAREGRAVIADVPVGFSSVLMPVFSDVPESSVSPAAGNAPEQAPFADEEPREPAPVRPAPAAVTRSPFSS